MLKTSFFNKVARHNLERFHSEVLAWIFETFEEASKSFVCYVNQNVTCEQIKSIKVEAETSQTDILIQYQIEDCWHPIYIENKIKATEHEIENMSQTSYYYERVNDQKNAIFIYLKPSKINLDLFQQELSKNQIDSSELLPYFNAIQLNNWSLPIPNPWLTLCYQDIHNVIYDVIEQQKECLDKDLALAYLHFIQEFPSYFNPFSISNEGVNAYSQYESYKFLCAIVNTNLKKELTEHLFKYYHHAKSANGSEPLMAFFVAIPCNLCQFFFKGHKDQILNVGLQLQGSVVKFYVSASKDDYSTTSLKNLKEAKTTYQSLCRFILEDITRENLKEFKSGKNFNKNTSKTFYSRSFNLKELEMDDPYNSIKLASVLTKYILQINSRKIIELIDIFSVENNLT